MTTTFRPNSFKDDAPSLEVSIFNRATVFDMLGLSIDSESVGESDKLYDMLGHVVMVDPSNYTRETNKEGNWTFCGLSDLRVQQYRDELIKIVKWCIKHHDPLVWA